ncbi:MAG: allantoate amidohydrolase [Propionicimonas sp.]|uniref:allantoate amidohydrolase n=1 Tax=Propionicimonas sp. TaxID=1955623 RepID=UPI002B20417F|nr:allantoate amidohydrolase [Propionicimonas sp.]MEA4943949.1 allantoate amidohydrolase [Propionicimonas sp.]
MATATGLLAELAPIGRDRGTGGYDRLAWEAPTLELREWFAAEATRRGFDLTEDGNGNQLAWWGHGDDALLVGSHLDSVRGGGAYDGPLGVVSTFAALDLLRARGFAPSRPVVVANFTDEEGARFGVACVGSRLATGALSAERALGLRDQDGTTLAEAMAAQGRDPAAVGPSDWLGQVGAFVELHVEQGRHLADGEAAVGVASAIWPHGRYRLDLTGEPNHAGTTAMVDRHDPMLSYAAAVLAAARIAEETGQRATFGRIQVLPGNTNAIPVLVQAWLDARADSEPALEQLVGQILAETRQAAAAHGTGVDLTAESVTAAVAFDAALRDRLAGLLGAPTLPTGAGHDAGILAARVPTAMLFVRNPTGVSHAPSEFATPDDCEAGVAALARVIENLA